MGLDTDVMLLKDQKFRTLESYHKILFQIKFSWKLAIILFEQFFSIPTKVIDS